MGQKQAQTQQSIEISYEQNLPFIEKGRKTLNILEALSNMDPEEQNYSVNMDQNINQSNPGKQFQDLYIFDQPLGKGINTEIFMITHFKSGLLRTAKIIRLTSIIKLDSLKQDVQQIKILVITFVTKIILKQDHPNLMSVVDYYFNVEYFYMIMEYYNGETLLDRVRQNRVLDENEVQKIMKQLLSAVKYLHTHHIIHGDIKPESILFETELPGSQIKLISYGLSDYLTPRQMKIQIINNVYYKAPEFQNRHSDKKSDIWSCGIIMFMLLFGQPPFLAYNHHEIQEKINEGKLNFEAFEFSQYVSQEAKDFIKKMLTVNVEDRINADQALENPWFFQND